jgi:hypothetical protein
MESIAKADIFFFVTTIFVVLLAIALIIVTVYVIKILQDLKDISEIVKSETLHIAGDVEQLRADVKRNGFNFPSILRFFRNVFSGKRRHLD